MTRSLNAVCKIGKIGKVGAAVALCIGCLAALPETAEAQSAPSGAEAAQAAPDCGFEIVSPSDAAAVCRENPDAAADRAYLVETATPGFTMTLQGVDVAIERLHPQFVHRLAGAVRDARAAGLASAGIFSAYRPPAFGVGGFSDKFNSLHTYGLAVDMTGIGGPGSVEAKAWYEIAARHGVVCPYGVENRVEWNHCQPTWIKIVRTNNPLRETVTADGPVSLDNMFEAGSAIIDHPPEHPVTDDHVGSAAVARTETPEKGRHESPRGECRDEPKSESKSGLKAGCGSTHVLATARAHAVVVAQTATARSRCQDEGRPHAKLCGALRGPQTAERQTAERRPAHSRQAANRGGRESHRV
jgi:hypothetical protein